MINSVNDFSLLGHNTFGMDVKASRWIEYQSVEELQQVLSSLQPDSRILHIGAGSNLLFLGDFDGTVLHSLIRGQEVVKEDGDHVWIRVGAGVVWDDFVDHCVANGWGGAENLSLIPGEVGASAVQNIGAYGVEVKDLIATVEAVDRQGCPHAFRVDECGYGYRWSHFKGAWTGQYVVTHVTYRLDKHPLLRLEYGNLRSVLPTDGTEITVAMVREAVIAVRRAKLPDPKDLGSAGSFFMNPVVERNVYERLKAQYPDIPHYEVDASHVKIPAGWMIDRCGWKGKTMGRAGVYAAQALVLVNLGGATGQEVLRLAEAVVQSVREKFGIEIRPEVNMIGNEQSIG